MYGGWHLIPWTLQYIAAAAVILVVSIYVFMKNKESDTSRWFLLFGLSIMNWQIFAFLHRNAPTADLSMWLMRVFLFFSMMGSALLLVTMLSMFEKGWRYVVSLIPMLIVTTLISTSAPLEIIWTGKLGWTYKMEGSYFYSIYIITLAYISAIGITGIYIWKRHPDLNEKIRFILIGWMGVVIIGTMISNVWLVDNPSVRPIGGILQCIGFLLISYGIYLPVRGIGVDFDVEELDHELFDHYIEFLNGFREGLPGKELGESAFRFKEYLEAMGLNDFVDKRGEDIYFNPEDFGAEGLEEGPDTVLRVLKECEWAKHTIDRYRDIFIESYKAIKERSEEEADRWLEDMIVNHGAFLNRYDMLEDIREDIEGRFPISLYSMVKEGCIYIFQEERPREIYEELERFNSAGYDFLIFTKLSKDYISEFVDKKDLEKGRVIRLSLDEGAAPKPTEISWIEEKIKDISTSLDTPIIVFDCLDQMIYSNGLRITQELVYSIDEMCEERSCILFFSIDPEKIEGEMMNELRKVCKRWRRGRKT